MIQARPFPNALGKDDLLHRSVYGIGRDGLE
jgi:hypothetical protein